MKKCTKHIHAVYVDGPILFKVELFQFFTVSHENHWNTHVVLIVVFVAHFEEKNLKMIPNLGVLPIKTFHIRTSCKMKDIVRSIDKLLVCNYSISKQNIWSILHSCEFFIHGWLSWTCFYNQTFSQFQMFSQKWENHTHALVS